MKAFPDVIFDSHLAALGKTGSGKTTSAKLAIEQIVKDRDARVCIIDPIKSDWWGLTLQADGKRPALPFTILGGPYGHVPLHAAAGEVIGRVVASGALRHSIIDMADFHPGEPAKFFCAFAQALFRNMQGVLYLVVEEAHSFAPKEKPGYGEETKSTHWMGRIATGGRSKGIRLIVCTQRVQALHNAVLGSCETVIAHRLTFPADQKPVTDWLASNLTKDQAKEISASLSGLTKGQGWICSGEAGIHELRKFPMITTYDNSATPKGDKATSTARPPAIDNQALSALIGDAVKQAEENDPAHLRRRIAELEKQLKAGSKGCITEAEVKTRIEQAVFESELDINGQWIESISKFTQAIHAATDMAAEKLLGQKPAPYQEALAKKEAKPWPKRLEEAKPLQSETKPLVRETKPPATSLAKAERAVLGVLIQYPDGCTRTKTALIAGYSPTSGGFRNTLSALRTQGLIDGGEILRATSAGREALPDVPKLPRGQALIEYWCRRLTKCEREILQVLTANPGQLMSREQIACRCESDYSATSGGFRNSLSKLRTLSLIDGRGDAIKASNVFFE